MLKSISFPLSDPTPKNTEIKPIRIRSLVVYTRNGQFALSQRKERFLHGLWGFMQYEELENNEGKFLGHITQHYSHFTLQADVYISEEDFVNEDGEWFSREEINFLSLSRADYKVLQFID